MKNRNSEARVTPLHIFGLIGLAKIGFIGLYGFIAAAHRSGVAVFHGFADAVAHGPGGLVGNAKHSVELVCRHTLLAGR